jgi:hypothetical protein
MSTHSMLAKFSLLSAALAASIVLLTGAHAASGPIVPMHGSPVLATTGNTVTTIITRDHRSGVYPWHCHRYCGGEGGLGSGKPAQLPSGYQLPQGGQVRDHRS